LIGLTVLLNGILLIVILLNDVATFMIKVWCSNPSKKIDETKKQLYIFFFQAGIGHHDNPTQVSFE
jgi:hypothetical protein